MDATEGSAQPGPVRPWTRLAALARLTADLAQASSAVEVSDIITGRAATVLDADGAMLVLREGARQLRSLGTRGLTRRQRKELAVFDIDREGPVAEAVRTRSVVVISDRAELAERYPQLDDGTERSSVVLPLLSHGPGDALGAIAFRFDGRGLVFGEEDMAVLSVMADMCAQTVQRLAAEAAREEQSRRVRFLADASQVLASTMDYGETLGRVADLAVPDHADWCSVQLIEDGVLRTLSVAHVDPAKVALAREVQSRWPADPNAPGAAAQVARSGVSLLVEDITDEMLVAAARDEEHLRIARELGLVSALSVPLRAHHRVLGVLTLVWAESGRHYTPADVAFAEDIGRRAGLAIDNADLYSQTRRVAAELQATLLPHELPALTGWESAASYRQAGRTEVGGDFYDIVPVDEDRIAVVIGDVMGRGTEAAVAGSRLRNAVRVLMSQDPNPDTLARAMDGFMLSDPPTELATAAYLLFDTRRECVSSVVAGHPPPLLIGADGSAAFVEESRSPLLGVGRFDRTSTSIRFGAGDLMLLYTDGLVERRDEGIDVGLERLRACAADILTRGPRASLADRLCALVDRVSSPDRGDDVAVVALRRTD
jgi:GAF domain-containing protein